MKAKICNSSAYFFIGMLSLMLPVLTALAAPSAVVRDPEIDKLKSILNMSLEDLLDLTVETGTKSPRRLHKTPGIIRVFTQDDFRRYGFKTLKDVLRHIPGYELNESRAGHTNLFIRGVQDRTTSKILLLIDGVPMRDLYWGNFSVDEMITLNNIEQVELLNGPGSVLYGANAFAGIINIRTKSKGRSVQARYGMQGSFKDGQRVNDKPFHHLSGEWSEAGWYGFGEFFKSQGFNPERNVDGEWANRPQDKEKKHLFAKYQKNGLMLAADLTDYTYPYLLSSAGNERFFKRKPFYLTARYEHETKNKTLYSIQAFYNHSELLRLDTRYKNNELNRRRYGYRNGSLLGLDADTRWRWQSHQITLGVSWLRDKSHRQENVSYYFSGGELTKTKTKAILQGQATHDDVAVFVQDIWDVNQYLTVTAGLRYSWLSDFDNQLTYRLGLNAEYEQFYGKLLYGSAFRVPTYRESFKLYDNPEIGINQLKPEQLLTLEAQLGYRFDKADVNLTVYHNRYTDFMMDLITLSVNDALLNPDDPKNGDEYTFNLDEIKTTGLELAVAWYPTERVSLRVSASALLQAEETAGTFPDNVVLRNPYPQTTQDLNFLSKYSLSLATAWQFHPKYRLMGDLRYNSRRSVSGVYQSGVDESLQQLDNPRSFVLVNLGLEAQLKPQITTELRISNLFNERAFNPNIQDPTEYDIEWPGRSISLGLRMAF
ncbi:TonB-dependent receptor [Candidatus Venteria ishoeyi]|uniref:TonB-dependent receptor plug domain-containing protein n=1 Tax=Candidatus Venteria ishoeyi TaxID=1899563 RepID=UPI0025A66C9C|nr:TonB-dependent receptor [Candidatus Venteria ishoeyi]MDM8546826.1 TonB-dependent receptor [Candidatus Venteria ishoeyi]